MDPLASLVLVAGGLKWLEIAATVVPVYHYRVALIRNSVCFVELLLVPR